MAKYTRSQQAQIKKRIRLRGDHDFSRKDKKCIVCGHRWDDPNCYHTADENQEVLELFSESS